MTDERLPDQPSIEDLTPLLRINKLCDQFQKAWKSGEAPRIEDYLERVSEGAKESLLRNLLPIDIEARRRKAKESPSSDEYIQRFPNHSRLIRQAFFESTMGSFHHDVSTPSVAATVSLIPVAKRLGDYVLGQELGRGGFGVVHEARHARRGDRVALKTLPLEAVSRDLHTPATEEKKRKSADRLVRFKREFRALADINHPNLVGLHSLESDGGQWFFTMDLIDGSDFIDYVRPGGKLDEAKLRHALPQLVAGVMALHSRNVIHRDLKPSNVMVSHEGRLMILDFGLVAELERQSDSASVAGFVGTPAYAAPEQVSAQHSAASDWYSVGTILYEALTNTRPFKGSATEILNDKQQTDPPAIGSNFELPSDLTNLAMQLLSRDASLRPNPLEIAQLVSANEISVIASYSSSSTELIGRDVQLDRLSERLSNLKRSKQPQAVLIHGRSGEGKTSLVEYFLDVHRSDHNFTVLSGRCYDRESVPFKALDGMMDALCDILRRMPGEDVALLLPDDMAFLVQLFPVLQRIEVISRADLPSVAVMDRIQVQHRGFKALKILLTRLSRRTPILMFADDLQWGDSESAEALFKILSDNEPPTLMFIGTYRIDETNESRFLQRWDELQEEQELKVNVETIGVTSLSLQECTHLMVDRLGRDNALIRQRAIEFAEKTGGNPYLLIELIGCFNPETNSFEALSLPEVIERKLSRLNDTARDVLRVVSVSGKAIGLTETFHAIGLDSIDAGTISHMRSENLLRMIGTGEEERVDTYHDKIRETVLEQLPETAQRDMHLALASTIEELSGFDNHSVQDLFDLKQEGKQPEELGAHASDIAIHFAGAGQKKRAMAYALIAAESARRQFAFDVAVDLFELAKTNLFDAGGSILYRFNEGYGRALIQMGRYDEALPLLEQATDSTNDDILTSKADQAIAEIYQRRGEFLKSLEVFRRIEARIGMKVYRSSLGYAWGALVCWLQWRMLRRKTRKRLTIPTQLDAVVIRVLVIRKMVDCWMNTVRDTYVTLASLVLTVRLDDPGMQSYCKGIESVFDFQFGKYHRANTATITFLEKLLNSSDLTFYSQMKRSVGWLQIWNGRLREAVQTLDQAEAFSMERMPDMYSVYISRCWRAYALVQLGELVDAMDESQDVFEYAVRTGHTRFAGLSLENWTRATNGQLPFVELRNCFGDVSEDITLSIQLLCAEARYYSNLGLTASSIDAARRAISTLRQNLLVMNFSTIAIPTFIKAAREHAMAIASSNQRESRILLRKALRLGWWGPRIARFTETHHAAIYRETAEVLRVKNRPKRALRLARKSIEIAERQGARYELAQARLLVAELSEDMGLPDSDKLLSNAKEGMVEFEQMIEANASRWANEPRHQDRQF